jgi:hypothetical protein
MGLNNPKRTDASYVTSAIGLVFSSITNAVGTNGWFRCEVVFNHVAGVKQTLLSM